MNGLGSGAPSSRFGIAFTVMALAVTSSPS